MWTKLVSGLPGLETRIFKYASRTYHAVATSRQQATARCPDSMNSQELSRNPFFYYDSGRWLWDEAKELRKRYQPFDVQRLKEAAVSSVNAKSCVNMIKLPEGAYNKVFLLTMDNGAQVIARIPNPFLPPKVSTASEVATLDFLRNELDIPVPRVLAWSADKNQPIGVEYIIMEKAPGAELRKSWLSMDISDKYDVMAQIASIQAKICSVDFKYYGSLYYRGDVHGYRDIPGIPSRFCIGPSSAVQFWEAERVSMDEFRGPWESPLSYAEDIAKRELCWIGRYAKLQDPSHPLRQSTSQESPGCHIQILNKYLQILPKVMPADQNIYRSTLWHSDLHSGNIFVEGNKIVSIIDWQGCMSLPLFLNCKLPKFLDIEGPLLFDLPSSKGLTSQEKKDTLLRYYVTNLQQLYYTRLNKLDESIFRAFSYPHAITRQQLIDFAGSTWEDDGLFYFTEMMHEVWQDWGDITSQEGDRTCPISFSQDELSSHIDDANTWDKYKAFLDHFDIPIDGWVHPEDFRAKAETMQNLVREALTSSSNQEETRQTIRDLKLTDPRSTNLSSYPMDI